MEENSISHLDEGNNNSFNSNNNDKEIAKVNETLLFKNHYPITSFISEIKKYFIQKQRSQENSNYTFYIKIMILPMNLINETKNISYNITNLQDILFLKEQGILNNSYITTTISLFKILKNIC